MWVIVINFCIIISLFWTFIVQNEFSISFSFTFTCWLLSITKTYTGREYWLHSNILATMLKNTPSPLLSSPGNAGNTRNSMVIHTASFFWRGVIFWGKVFLYRLCDGTVLIQLLYHAYWPHILLHHVGSKLLVSCR